MAVSMTNYTSHLEKLLKEYGENAARITIRCKSGWKDNEMVEITGVPFRFSRDVTRFYLSNASMPVDDILEIYAGKENNPQKIYPPAQE